MPDQTVVFVDRPVGGEDAAHRGIGDRHLQPFFLISVVIVQPALRHGIGTEVLQHEIAVSHGAPVAQQQAVVQILQNGGILGHQRSVDHLRHGQADFLVALEDAHGIVAVLPVHIQHGVAPHAEDVNVVHPDLLADLDVRAVHRADGDRAVHHELHVAGAAGFLAGGAELLGNLRRGNQHLRAGDIVVLQEHDLQHLPGPGMLFDQPAQGTDHADGLLRPDVSGAGLGAEDEDSGLHGEALVVHDPVVQHKDVKSIQHLALVFMQPLRLDVEHEVRIDLRPLMLLQHLREAFLILALDLPELLAEGRVVRIGQQLLEHLRLPDPLVTDRLLDQAGQAGVAAHQPAAVGNAVGNGAEFLGHDLIVVMEGVALQNLAVQLADAVHAVAHRDEHVRHVHIVIADDGHVGDPVPVPREGVPQPLAQPAVHLADDLVAPGQQLLHHMHRPLLQRLGHDRVVGVGNGLLHDGAGLIPAQAFLVHQDAHQLGDGHARVRIVDMDDHLLRQLRKVIAEGALEFLDDVLQAGAGKEVVLLQPEHLALIVLVLGIEHLADRLRQLDFLAGLNVAALAEAAQIQLLRAAGAPHPQGVHCRGVITHDGHIVGNGLHRVIIPRHKLFLAVDFNFFHMAAEMDLAGVLHHGAFPGVAVVQPAVGKLNLLAVDDFLTEQAVLVADGAAHGRQIQAAQAVHKAGCQPSEAAVAQTGFRLLLQQVLDVNSQLLQGIGILLAGNQIQHIGIHAAAHQEFHAQVVEALFPAALPLLPGDHVFLHDLVAHGGSHGAVDLLGSRFVNGQAIVPLKLSNDRVLDRLFVKFGCWHSVISFQLPFRRCKKSASLILPHFCLYGKLFRCLPLLSGPVRSVPSAPPPS